MRDKSEGDNIERWIQEQMGSRQKKRNNASDGKQLRNLKLNVRQVCRHEN